MGGWARNRFCVWLSHHTFSLVSTLVQVFSRFHQFLVLVCAETPAKSYRVCAVTPILYVCLIRAGFFMETAQFGVGLAHYSSQVERPMLRVRSGDSGDASPRRSTLPRSLSSSRALAIMKFGAGAGVDPFVKVKGLITDLINRFGGLARGEPQIILR